MNRSKTSDGLPCSTLQRLTDVELRDAVLRREEGAWLELMRRFRSVIFGCIHKTLYKFNAVVSNEAADEIFSEVCIHLLRDDMKKLRLYNPERGCKLSSWMGMISLNCAYDYLRACARMPMLDALEGHCNVTDAAPSPLEFILSQERSLLLHRLARGLSSRDRRFLDLYFHRELPPTEIARTMRISVKTVYSKRNKIQRRLCELMQIEPELRPLAA